MSMKTVCTAQEKQPWVSRRAIWIQVGLNVLAVRFQAHHWSHSAKGALTEAGLPEDPMGNIAQAEKCPAESHFLVLFKKGISKPWGACSDGPAFPCYAHESCH